MDLWPEALLVGLLGLCIAGMGYLVYFGLTHTCVRTEYKYVAPTYVKIGGILTPVGGGMKDVCVEWKKL